MLLNALIQERLKPMNYKPFKLISDKLLYFGYIA